MRDEPSFGWMLIVVALVLVSVVAWGAATSDCDKRGGVLVRTLTIGGYECIPRLRP